MHTGIQHIPETNNMLPKSALLPPQLSQLGPPSCSWILVTKSQPQCLLNMLPSGSHTMLQSDPLDAVIGQALSMIQSQINHMCITGNHTHFTLGLHKPRDLIKEVIKVLITGHTLQIREPNTLHQVKHCPILLRVLSEPLPGLRTQHKDNILLRHPSIPQGTDINPKNHNRTLSLTLSCSVSTGVLRMGVIRPRRGSVITRRVGRVISSPSSSSIRSWVHNHRVIISGSLNNTSRGFPGPGRRRTTGKTGSKGFIL